MLICLDPRSSMFMCFYAMFYAQIYVSTCLYVQIYMVRVLCHVSLVLFLSLLCVDDQGYVLTCLISCLWLCFARIYVLMCLLPCLMRRSASVHAYMLGSTFFHVYVLAFTCSHTLPCLCLNLHFYMLACSDLGFHMLICPDLFFHMLMCLDLYAACFILSSMCLCAPCHVYVPRPRLCLSCRVLLQPFCCFIFFSCVLAYQLGHDLDLMVFVIIRTPWPISKGLDHPCLHVYACMLLCFTLMLASFVLGFATLDTLSGLWLCDYIRRP